MLITSLECVGGLCDRNARSGITSRLGHENTHNSIISLDILLLIVVSVPIRGKNKWTHELSRKISNQSNNVATANFIKYFISNSELNENTNEFKGQNSCHTQLTTNNTMEIRKLIGSLHYLTLTMDWLIGVRKTMDTFRTE